MAHYVDGCKKTGTNGPVLMCFTHRGLCRPPQGQWALGADHDQPRLGRVTKHPQAGEVVEKAA